MGLESEERPPRIWGRQDVCSRSPPIRPERPPCVGRANPLTPRGPTPTSVRSTASAPSRRGSIVSFKAQSLADRPPHAWGVPSPACRFSGSDDGFYILYLDLWCDCAGDGFCGLAAWCPGAVAGEFSGVAGVTWRVSVSGSRFFDGRGGVWLAGAVSRVRRGEQLAAGWRQRSCRGGGVGMWGSGWWGYGRMPGSAGSI